MMNEVIPKFLLSFKHHSFEKQGSRIRGYDLSLKWIHYKAHGPVKNQNNIGTEPRAEGSSMWHVQLAQQEQKPAPES